LDKASSVSIELTALADPVLRLKLPELAVSL